MTPISPRGKRAERWVVKAGSQLVCGGGPLLLRAWMEQLARIRRERGIEIVWVTSGAIASAADRRGGGRGRSLDESQALSAIGQPIVMDQYNLALNACGLTGAQILLTYDDLARRERCRNFRNTVRKLLQWGVVPILNENDAMATEEIRFGDNDSLSAKVAAVLEADRLVILTDVDGLFDRDPRRSRQATLIRALPRVSAELLRSARKSGGGSDRGTGGMFSKLRAAAEAGQAGIDTWLVRGDRASVLLEVAGGREVGTRIGTRFRAGGAKAK